MRQNKTQKCISMRKNKPQKCISMRQNKLQKCIIMRQNKPQSSYLDTNFSHADILDLRTLQFRFATTMGGDPGGNTSSPPPQYILGRERLWQCPTQ